MGKVNWLAVVAGLASLLLIAVSLFVPWWKFTVGTGSPTLAQANFSPVNLNVAIFGTPLTVPLIWALNMASLLSLMAGAIIMLIYAVVPAKSYSKRLLSFGYNKPLLAVLLFVIELVALVVIAKSLVGFDVPLMGPAMINLPPAMSNGANVDIAVSVTASFEWPFYFAIVVAGLCIAARIYHRKVASAPTVAK